MRVRPPAVAGAFYDARPDRLDRDVRSRLALALGDSGAPSQPRAAFGAIVPHAGYVYSGPVAAAA